jgi:hypothetical protein
MAKKKEGWEKGLGPFSKDNDMPLRPAKGDNNGSAKGTELKEVWSNNDAPAIRGGRPNRDLSGS